MKMCCPVLSISSNSFFLAIWATVLILRTRREEEIMTKLFGKEYADYMLTTKRIVPFIY